MRENGKHEVTEQRPFIEVENPQAVIAAPGEPERFPLDDAAIGLFAEYQAQIDQVSAAQRGMLTLFVRQHGLQGNWQLAPGGRELVRRGDEQMQQP